MIEPQIDPKLEELRGKIEALAKEYDVYLFCAAGRVENLMDHTSFSSNWGVLIDMPGDQIGCKIEATNEEIGHTVGILGVMADICVNGGKRLHELRDKVASGFDAEVAYATVEKQILRT